MVSCSLNQMNYVKCLQCSHTVTFKRNHYLLCNRTHQQRAQWQLSANGQRGSGSRRIMGRTWKRYGLQAPAGPQLELLFSLWTMRQETSAGPRSNRHNLEPFHHPLTTTTQALHKQTALTSDCSTLLHVWWKIHSHRLYYLGTSGVTRWIKLFQKMYELMSDSLHAYYEFFCTRQPQHFGEL